MFSQKSIDLVCRPYVGRISAVCRITCISDLGGCWPAGPQKLKKANGYLVLVLAPLWPRETERESKRQREIEIERDREAEEKIHVVGSSKQATAAS